MYIFFTMALPSCTAADDPSKVCSEYYIAIVKCNGKMISFSSPLKDERRGHCDV